MGRWAGGLLWRQVRTQVPSNPTMGTGPARSLVPSCSLRRQTAPLQTGRGRKACLLSLSLNTLSVQLCSTKPSSPNPSISRPPAPPSLFPKVQTQPPLPALPRTTALPPP